MLKCVSLILIQSLLRELIFFTTAGIYEIDNFTTYSIYYRKYNNLVYGKNPHSGWIELKHDLPNQLSSLKIQQVRNDGKLNHSKCKWLTYAKRSSRKG